MTTVLTPEYTFHDPSSTVRVKTLSGFLRGLLSHFTLDATVFQTDFSMLENLTATCILQ